MTEEGLNDPKKFIKVKIFHNDSRPWPNNCEPEKGTVMLMQIKVSKVEVNTFGSMCILMCQMFFLEDL